MLQRGTHMASRPLPASMPMQQIHQVVHGVPGSRIGGGNPRHGSSPPVHIPGPRLCQRMQQRTGRIRNPRCGQIARHLEPPGMQRRQCLAQRIHHTAVQHLDTSVPLPHHAP